MPSPGKSPFATQRLASSATFALLVVATAAAADWPHWRGANRDGHAAESSGYSGVPWPPSPALWTAEVGQGASSPLVIGERLYVMGWSDGRDRLSCLDAPSGRLLWQVSYPCGRYGRHATGDEGLYAGVTSTPEYDRRTAYLYTLSADGDLNCWDIRAAGRKVWGRNLYDDYGARRRAKIGRSPVRDYGYTSSPLLAGDTLVVEVGSPEGNLMGFDKITGRRRWASESKDQAGHTAGPVPITVEGIPCVAVLTLHQLLIARLDEENQGHTVAEYPWTTEFANNVVTPVVSEDNVLITSGYNHRAMCRLRITLRGASKVWEQPYYSKVGTPIVHRGQVIWAWRRVTGLDFRTGHLLWSGQSATGDAGSCVLTEDGRLVVWANRGELLLVEPPAPPDTLPKQLAAVSLPCRDDVWPHVVLSGGRLYCKDRWGKLLCFSTERAIVAPPAGPTPAGATSATDHSPWAGLAAKTGAWPGRDEDVLLAWQEGFGPGEIVGPGGRLAARWRFQPRGKACFGEDRRMELADGAMLVHGADQLLLDACKRSNQLGIEIVLATGRAVQTGPARILSFSTNPYSRNFTLAQDGNRLVFRLRTTETDPNGTRPQTDLCPVAAGRTYHLIVAYQPGRLVAYLDGRKVCERSAVRGDLDNWTPQHLLLGDEWKDTRDWDGTVRRVALWSRFIDDREAARRYRQLRAAAATSQNR